MGYEAGGSPQSPGRIAAIDQIVAICAEKPTSYSELRQATQLSDAGLAKDLNTLVRRGLIIRMKGSYAATSAGEKAAERITLGNAIAKQKLARKLLVLQNTVDIKDLPKEMASFEAIFALLGRPPVSVHKYLAYATVSALTVAYSGVAAPAPIDELSIYDKALKTLRQLLASMQPQENGSRISITIDFDLDKGYRSALEKLKTEITLAHTESEREKLTTILDEMTIRKDELMMEAIQRFIH